MRTVYVIQAAGFGIWFGPAGLSRKRTSRQYRRIAAAERTVRISEAVNVG